MKGLNYHTKKQNATFDLVFQVRKFRFVVPKTQEIVNISNFKFLRNLPGRKPFISWCYTIIIILFGIFLDEYIECKHGKHKHSEI